MKLFAAFLLMINMISCNDEIQINSSKKQLIIPGVQTAKRYINYQFEVEIKNTINITIDSVLIFDKNKTCCKANAYIFESKTNKILGKIKNAGKYVIYAHVKENSIRFLENCNSSENKVAIYFKKDGQSKKIVIKSFIEETIRKR